jgi:hypothetical protein
MWIKHCDYDDNAEDWVVNGEVLATVRKPPVATADAYPWLSSIAYEGQQVVAGLLPNQRAAKAAALAILAEFS